MQIPFCPILRPTMEQFQNFYEYVEKIERLYKSSYGIVKIIPPPQWKPRKTDYSIALKDLHIQGPIEQNLYGKGGVYQCLHIAKKSMSYEEYRLKALELDNIVKGMTVEHIEETFWKNIVFSPPLYGADLLNSLMEPCSGNWDLKNLNSLLSQSMSHKIRGVNDPYCYVGQWKALFCWHKEDLDLSAINYVHQGKSKFWYGIPSHMGQILEKEAEKLFPEHFRICNQFLRHKTTLINPYLLKRKNPELVVHKAEQKENQFIIAFGGAYHSGFNFGFNLAQAVNFASLDWLRQLTESKSCTCLKSSVKASPIQIYKNLIQTPLAKTKQFEIFQEYIFKMIEEDEQESEDEGTKKGVKKQFSKKIKKEKKLPKKVLYGGEQYEIDHWIECEKCQTWRLVKASVPNKGFLCHKIGKKCSTKQKAPKHCFTISAVS